MTQELFNDVTPWLYPLMDLTVLLVALIKFSRSFWGRLLAAAAGLQLLTGLFWRSIFTFSEGSFPEWFYTLNPVVQSMNLYAAALFVLALASIPFSSAVSQATAGRATISTTPGAKGDERNVWLLALLILVTVNIYWVVWLYRVVRDIRKFAPDALAFTPGKAVGFLFIPFFNIYWVVNVLRAVTRTIATLTKQLQAQHPSLDSNYAGPVVMLLIAVGFIFNSLGFDHYGFLIAGEAIFLTSLGYTQRFLNQIWRVAA